MAEKKKEEVDYNKLLMEAVDRSMMRVSENPGIDAYTARAMRRVKKKNMKITVKNVIAAFPRAHIAKTMRLLFSPTKKKTR